MKEMKSTGKSFFHLKMGIAQLILILVTGVVAFAQANPSTDAEVKPTPSVIPAIDASDPQNARNAKAGKLTTAEFTAEQIAESVIFIYGGGLGRINLDQIRKTANERGKLTIIDAKGKTEQAKYERWIQRGENTEKDLVRFDTEFPNSKFALISKGERVFGVYNNQIFTPTEDAVREFQNRIVHGLETILRYKENGSTLELVKRDEKIMGVSFNIIDVIDKEKRKTRFYVSIKSFRVMMLEYTEDSVNYRRKFYDYNYAQGTLVPYRSVLWANDKKIEEMNVQTISYGQKVEDDMFAGK